MTVERTLACIDVRIHLTIIELAASQRERSGSVSGFGMVPSMKPVFCLACKEFQSSIDHSE